LIDGLTDDINKSYKLCQNSSRITITLLNVYKNDTHTHTDIIPRIIILTY